MEDPQAGQAFMTYSQSVDYKGLDAFKRHAQAAARETARYLARLGYEEISATRGESGFAFRSIKPTDATLVNVHEGLGTKNVVADAMLEILGYSCYDKVAQCNMAMAVNDFATLGAASLVYGMHLAVSDDNWFNTPHPAALVRGTWMACAKARITWGYGETPTLRGVIVPGTVELSCSATGVIREPHHFLNGNRIKEGDVIVAVGGSGPHSNGLSLMRRIASKLDEGYRTKLSDGRMYGEHLLEPTVIYAALIEDALTEGLDLHSAIHISGHGWRKLMRALQSFRYVVDRLPSPQEVFNFIMRHGPVDLREAYGNFNMGAGFAIYLPLKDAGRLIQIAKRLGYNAWIAGHIEAAETSSVVLKEPGIIFQANELEVR